MWAKKEPAWRSERFCSSCWWRHALVSYFHDKVWVIDDWRVVRELLVGNCSLLKLLCVNTQAHTGDTRYTNPDGWKESHLCAFGLLLPRVISLLSVRPPHREMATCGRSAIWSHRLSTPLSMPLLPTDCGDWFALRTPGVSESALVEVQPPSLREQKQVQPVVDAVLYMHQVHVKMYTHFFERFLTYNFFYFILFLFLIVLSFVEHIEERSFISLQVWMYCWYEIKVSLNPCKCCVSIM